MVGRNSFFFGSSSITGVVKAPTPSRYASFTNDTPEIGQTFYTGSLSRDPSYGVLGNGGYWDGTKNPISNSNLLSGTTTSSRSMVLWINIRDMSQRNVIVSHTLLSGTFGNTVETSGLVTMGGSGSELSSNATLSQGVWYHLGFVWDYSNTTKIIYINGVLDNSNSITVPFGGINRNNRFGCYSSNSSTNFQAPYLNAYVDEVACWSSTALSADQIKSIYKNGVLY